MFLIRLVWLTTGLLFVGLGLAGAVLPLVPTTVFLLAAVFCFARSSPRLHRWLVEHPRFGPTITAWLSEGAVSRPAKRTAMTVMAVALCLSLLMGVGRWVLLAQAAVTMVVTAFLLTRPRPSGK